MYLILHVPLLYTSVIKRIKNECFSNFFHGSKENGSFLWYHLISSFIAARDSLTRIYGAGRWKLSIFLHDLANGLCAITSPGSRELSPDVDWPLSFLSMEFLSVILLWHHCWKEKYFAWRVLKCDVSDLYKTSSICIILIQA